MISKEFFWANQLGGFGGSQYYYLLSSTFCRIFIFGYYVFVLLGLNTLPTCTHTTYRNTTSGRKHIAFHESIIVLRWVDTVFTCLLHLCSGYLSFAYSHSHINNSSTLGTFWKYTIILRHLATG